MTEKSKNTIIALILTCPFWLFFGSCTIAMLTVDPTAKLSTIEVKEKVACTFYVEGKGWVSDYCSNANKYKGYKW